MTQRDESGETSPRSQLEPVSPCHSAHECPSSPMALSLPFLLSVTPFPFTAGELLLILGGLASVLPPLFHLLSLGVYLMDDSLSL